VSSNNWCLLKAFEEGQPTLKAFMKAVRSSDTLRKIAKPPTLL
jgi:hypothetical protein